MSGQSIMDRVAAAKHSIAGQGLAKSVCKATTEEIIGPKKKHLDYLLQCTNEPNVSIPQLADLLIERTQHSNWVVVYKALITIHNLVNYGNERFTQYLASNNCSFNLSGFVDKGGVQGYDMSTFIRRYAKYLNEKAVSYRQMAFDFCKVKRGKDDGLLRTMNAEKLLKTLPVLQAQLDALLEFDCTPNELTNGVINACFMLLFKDLIRLFACYNDGVINLLEKYFEMNKKQCKDGLDLYKKFLVRMEQVSEFLKVAENVGIDKGDIPDLAKGLKNNSFSAPASLLEALEQHLASLEGKKGAATTTTTPKPAGFSSALTAMTTNSSALSISDMDKKKLVDEETRQLHQLKTSDSEGAGAEASIDLLASEDADTNLVDEQRLKELTPSSKEATAAPPSAAPNNPFASQPSPPVAAVTPTSTPAIKPSDDLLGLTSNPFGDSVQTAMASAFGTQPQDPASNNPFGAPPFQPQQTNGFVAGSGTGFTSDADFAKAFQSSSPSPVYSEGCPVPRGSGIDLCAGLSMFFPAGAAFATPAIAPVSNAPPGLDLGSPLDPLDPSTPKRASTLSQEPPPPAGLASDLFLGTQSQPPCPSPTHSPSQPMAIPGAFGGGMMGGGGLSSSPMAGGGLSSSPMAGGLSSSPMGAGLGSSPMGAGFGAGAGPFGQLGVGPGAMGLSASPTGSARQLSRSPSPTVPDTTGFDAFGDVLQPLNPGGPAPAGGALGMSKAQEPKLLAKDLDSSLASLASNLSVNSPADQVKKASHQWQPKGESKLTGGDQFHQRPVIQSSTTWGAPQQTPFQQPMMGAPGMGFGQPQMAPAMGAPQPMMGMAPGMGGMRPGMGTGMGMQQPMMYGGMGTMPMARMPQQQQQPPAQNPQNDPFGAL
ncbi:hypothetical protein ACOMHN_053807 [Nucella lapillus]